MSRAGQVSGKQEGGWMLSWAWSCGNQGIERPLTLGQLCEGSLCTAVSESTWTFQSSSSCEWENKTKQYPYPMGQSSLVWHAASSAHGLKVQCWKETGESCLMSAELFGDLRHPSFIFTFTYTYLVQFYVFALMSYLQFKVTVFFKQMFPSVPLSVTCDLERTVLWLKNLELVV